ncbi:hypothetical protein [Rubrobacter naiadicus]|uniref:hypothetical protein n=1 Tax=Rubrobacter naiadicus TaxID=1392641 RepID=UPI0030811143
MSSASEGSWGPGGIYYLLSALGGAGLAGIGAAGMLRPGYMARWFGLPPDRPEDGGSCGWPRRGTWGWDSPRSRC